MSSVVSQKVGDYGRRNRSHEFYYLLTQLLFMIFYKKKCLKKLIEVVNLCKRDDDDV